jgi:hypothetical protein
MDYAELAVDSGANALMFSLYYGGGFLKMAEIAGRFNVPVYSHPDGPTAGVKALILAYHAYLEEGLTQKAELKDFAGKMGSEKKET